MEVENELSEKEMRLDWMGAIANASAGVKSYEGYSETERMPGSWGLDHEQLDSNEPQLSLPDQLRPEETVFEHDSIFARLRTGRIGAFQLYESLRNCFVLFLPRK